MSDLVRDGGKAASFIFFREITGVPLQVFVDARELLCKELNKIAAEVNRGITIASDNFPAVSYGCYVTGRKT